MNTSASLMLRLYAISKDGLRDANKGNPFISKSEAMKFINQFH